MVPKLVRYADADALRDAVAAEVAAQIGAAIAARGRAVVVLAGGNTPRGVYERMAKDASIDWAQVVLAFGDERCVPADDPMSNYRMVRETLLDLLPGKKPEVLRIEGELAPDEAAGRYEDALDAGGCDTFDVVLLGMGDDGHVASIFPATLAAGAAESAKRRTVVATTSPLAPAARVSLTLERLATTHALLTLVAGAGKAATLATAWNELAFADRPWAARLPAARLAHMIAADCTFQWHVDAAACSRLGEPPVYPAAQGSAATATSK